VEINVEVEDEGGVYEWRQMEQKEYGEEVSFSRASSSTSFCSSASASISVSSARPVDWPGEDLVVSDLEVEEEGDGRGGGVGARCSSDSSERGLPIDVDDGEVGGGERGTTMGSVAGSIGGGGREGGGFGTGGRFVRIVLLSLDGNDPPVEVERGGDGVGLGSAGGILFDGGGGGIEGFASTADGEGGGLERFVGFSGAVVATCLIGSGGASFEGGSGNEEFSAVRGWFALEATGGGGGT
jgi:hypothetical protein